MLKNSATCLTVVVADVGRRCYRRRKALLITRDFWSISFVVQKPNKPTDYTDNNNITTAVAADCRCFRKLRYRLIKIPIIIGHLIALLIATLAYYPAMAVGTHLAKLLSFIIANVSDTSNSANQLSAKNVGCYSCMSPLFAEKSTFPDGSQYDYWDTQSKLLFKKPENFTSFCDLETFDSSKIRIKPCLDTCVWLLVDSTFIGSRRGYMRGCLTDLKEHNFNTTLRMKHKTYCHTVPLKALFSPKVHSITKGDKQVHICACHTNKCNGAAMAIVLSTGGWIVLMLTLLLYYLF